MRKLASPIPVLSFHALTNCPFCNPIVLTFMHEMRSVGGTFHFSLLSSNFQHLTSAFSNSSALFCVFFARTENSTRFVSSNSELFRKDTRGGGHCCYRGTPAQEAAQSCVEVGSELAVRSGSWRVRACTISTLPPREAGAYSETVWPSDKERGIHAKSSRHQSQCLAT